jgi:hypothetical protein
MSITSGDLTARINARALLAGCQCSLGPAGPPGPPGLGVAPLYASFLSMTTQPVTTVNPVAISYSERTIGTININGTFPSSEIVIPVTGIFSILFSAQCDSSNGTHYLEIFPVVNGTSVANTNTRIRINSTSESCLVVEYLLSFNANDKLQLFMIGDNTNARLLALTRGGGTPVVPDIPSIIVNIRRIE